MPVRAYLYCTGYTVALEAFNQRIDLALAYGILLGKQHNYIRHLLAIGKHTGIIGIQVDITGILKPHPGGIEPV